MRLPCGVEKPTIRCQGQDVRASTSLPSLLRGLDIVWSLGSIPHRTGGDAVWARQTAGRHRVGACTVSEEESVRGPFGGSSREGCISPTCRPSRLNLYDPVLSPFLLQRLVVSCAMMPVQFWIIEYWLWWLCPRSKIAEPFIILLEEGIDKRD